MIIPIHKPGKPRIVPTRSKVGFSVCLIVTVVILMALASIGPRVGSTRAFHLSKPLQSSDPAIFVNNNTDLAAIADLGNGTAGNPYVIANKTILGASGSASIRIQNTSAYLRIWNCTTIHSTMVNYGDTGIFLLNCTNVELAGNNASLNTVGISIQSCNRINISGNLVTLNSYSFNIRQSDNFSRADTTIVSYAIGLGGVTLDSCMDISVKDNVLCDNYGSGISIWACSNISITGNDIRRNLGAGIDVYSIRHSFISNNDIVSNLEYGIYLVFSSDNEIAWNRFYYNEKGCISQDDYSYDNDVHDNDCKQSTTWTMDHVVVPAIKICVILAIFLLAFILVAKYRGRIRKWVTAHSRDVPLEQAYIALKDKIKDPAFLRGRIAELYVFVGGGIALSILINVFAEYMPIYYTLETFFFWAMVCTGIGFAAVGVAGAWAFKRKALKALISLRCLTGFAVMWMLVYFISYTIWPLYLLRYTYDVVGAGLFSVVYPGSQTFVEFPSYWIMWQGESHQFYISVGIVHPVIWGAFVGFPLFIPGQSVVSKVKKGLLLFLIDHAVYIITILIQQILHVTTQINFWYLHSSDETYVINTIVGVAWRVALIWILYPDMRVLLRSLVHGLKTEPVHVVFPNDAEDKIKRQFIADGGHELGGSEEIKQRNQRWGIAIKIGAEHELHVRAHGHGTGRFSLSAHFEYGRNSGKHLVAGGDYKEGKRILLDYLARKGFDLSSERIIRRGP